MTVCAMFWVRGPRWRTGRSFVQGSMASQRKTHLCGAAQPGAQFIQLEMRDPEMTKEAFVQDLCMRVRASEKGW